MSKQDCFIDSMKEKTERGEQLMCDEDHFRRLEDRVDRLEDDVKVYHARTDERLKTLFKACEKLSSTAATLLRAALTILGIVLIVSVFALVYGALGERGFKAVTTAAPTAAVR